MILGSARHLPGQSSRHRVLPAAMVALCLLLSAIGPRAWDADRLTLAARARSPEAVAGAKALRSALALTSRLDEGGKLAFVNRFWNERIEFRTDDDVWGQVDYWATPLETLEKGQGDCEDFAIAKYFSLLAIGVPMSHLRLVYVRALMAGGVQAHMVLAHYAGPAAEPVILDNLVADVQPAGRRADLTPVFSFNGAGIWQGVGPVAAGGDATSRLSRWRDVVDRARAEGFE